MFRKLFFLPLVAALAAFAGSAHAQGAPAEVILAAFRNLCVATGGERAAALAAAAKAGWFEAPEAALASSAPRFQNPVGRLHSDAAGFQFLILGEQARAIGGRGVSLHACAVGGSTSDAVRLDAGVQELAVGVPRAAALSDAGHSVWLFAEAAGRRASLEPDDARRVAAAVEARTLRYVSRSTRTTPGMPAGLSVLTLGVPAR